MKVINLEDVRHGIRVANMALLLGKLLEMDRSSLDNLYIACLFHDVGKAHVDQSVLNKKSILDQEEREQIKKHSFYSYKEMQLLGYSNKVTDIILYHHENYDGTGYPDGLYKDEIPIGARILKVIDVFDALTMERPYRKRLSQKAAIKIMTQEKEQYDPKVYKMFLAFLSFRHKKLKDKTQHYLFTKEEVAELITIASNSYYHEFPLVVPEDFSKIKEFAKDFSNVEDVHRYFYNY